MRTRAVLAVCAAGAFAASVQPAIASTRGQIRVGAAPHPAAGSKVLGSLGGGTPIGVTVALKPRDPAALAAFAAAVATPGSGVYHEYLTPAQFAQRFGPTGSQIAGVESSLHAHGLNPGAVSTNGLAIRVDATAGALANAFSTSFQRVGMPGGRTAYTNTSAPAVNANVAGDVQDVIGLDTLSVPQPLALRQSASRSGGVHPRAAPRAPAGEPQACTAATGAAPGYSALTADQLSSAYDFSGFYGAGDFGAGQTVAVYELEGNFRSDVAQYQACYGTSTSVTYQRVGTGPPAPDASQNDGLESALDIEDLIGLAPKANVIVYQGPNSDSVASGPYNTYAAIISDDKAQVISTSWGLCEAQTTPAGTSESQLDAENTLFQEAATQGQTILAAAGDSGSADCQPGGGSTAPAVDDPASQPFVTGVGGTTVTALGPPPSETVWNDGSQKGGGGGGISAQWPMPAYQSGAAAALKVINGHSSGAPCGAPAGTDCREVPDVAADAGGASSYLVYYDGGWTGVYGTSGAAPTWASLIALTNASSACTGSPIGFANPGLYRAAGSSAHASIFNDITVGNNDSSHTNGGLFAAGTGYDMATGLGTPIGAALPAALCGGTGANPGMQPTPVATFTPPPVVITSPGDQTGIVGRAVRLEVHAGNIAGARSYGAIGLPRGLSINVSTGLIAGTPTTAGSSSVTLRTAAASGGASAVTSFRWQINAAASVSHAALSGVGKRKPKLSLTVTAASGAPSIKTIVIGLPKGWGFTIRSRHSLDAVALKGPGGRPLKFSAKVIHGALRITLAGSSSTVRMTISDLIITVTKTLARKAARNHMSAVSVLVTATNSSNSTTRIGLKLRV